MGASTTTCVREGGYRVVGEADERDPLPIDRGHDGWVRARDCRW
jgi:hypothetical protein